MPNYRAICVNHHWHHRDHTDEAFVIGEYDTMKEALMHAVCWEIAENTDLHADEESLGNYGDLLVHLTKLNFDSSDEIKKFNNEWEEARYNFLLDNSTDSASGSYVSISPIKENYTIRENSLAEAWYKILLKKEEKEKETIDFFEEYYKEKEVTQLVFEKLEEIGLSKGVLDSMYY